MHVVVGALDYGPLARPPRVGPTESYQVAAYRLVAKRIYALTCVLLALLFRGLRAQIGLPCYSNYVKLLAYCLNLHMVTERDAGVYCFVRVQFTFIFGDLVGWSSASSF